MIPNVYIHSNGRVVTTNEDGIEIHKYSGDLRILHLIDKDRGNRDIPAEFRYYKCNYYFVVCENTEDTSMFKTISIPSPHVKELLKFIIKRRSNTTDIMNLIK